MVKVPMLDSHSGPWCWVVTVTSLGKFFKRLSHNRFEIGFVKTWKVIDSVLAMTRLRYDVTTVEILKILFAIGVLVSHCRCCNALGLRFSDVNSLASCLPSLLSDKISSKLQKLTNKWANTDNLIAVFMYKRVLLSAINLSYDSCQQSS